MIILKKFIKKILYYILLSPLLKRTDWYKNLFVKNEYPNNDWYRTHDERNFDIVALGSSGAKWAYEFKEVKGMNWANAPQTLVEDYNLLRNFHSILKEGGIVLITIMPFTSLNKKTNIYDAIRYLKTGAQAPIEPFLYRKASFYCEYPIGFGKPAYKALIKYLFNIKRNPYNNQLSELSYNPMNQEELEYNALEFINGWKNQFDISDLEAPLTEKNQEGRMFRVELMRKIIDFCIERNYKPIYVIPPVTQHLSKYFTPTFQETYIYNYLKDVNRNIPIIDLSKNTSLQKDELYFNSFFLNQKGRELFTKEVLTHVMI